MDRDAQGNEVPAALGEKGRAIYLGYADTHFSMRDSHNRKRAAAQYGNFSCGEWWCGQHLRWICWLDLQLGKESFGKWVLYLMGKKISVKE